MRSAGLSNALISIGELSRRTGVNIETIRYYERINMMPHPPRSTNGRRGYGEVETRTLAFIREGEEVRFATDSLLEEGVSSEPVSEARNSLLAANLQGISSIRARRHRQRRQKRASNQSLTGQFPMHPNREFFAALQGI